MKNKFHVPSYTVDMDQLELVTHCKIDSFRGRPQLRTTIIQLREEQFPQKS
jgi:hypothetical protein